MSIAEELALKIKDAQVELILVLIYSVVEYWLGRTPKTKAGSVIEIILNLFFKKKDLTKGEIVETQLGKMKVEFKEGQLEMSYPLVGEGSPVKLSAPVAPLVIPVIEGIEAKVASGEIDPIKGTDIDKDLMLRGLAEAKKLFV